MGNNNFNAVAIVAEAKTVSLEDCITRGMELRERKDNIAWELGDLAIMVREEFGKKYLSEFSKGIGIEVGTIRRYRDVSKAYEPKIREEFRKLSWSHFREVAAHEDRYNLLCRAHDENWSVEKLGIMKGGGSEGEAGSNGVIDDGRPVPPKPELQFCAGCRMWFIPSAEACPSDGQCPDLNK